MIVKSQQHVKVRHNQSGNTAEASVLEAGDKEFSLFLLSALDIFPGDEIELEFVRCSNVSYIIQGDVLETDGNKVHVLQDKPAVCRKQRRRSPRIIANARVEFVLLPDKDPATFQEGLIQDISREGILLSAQKPLELGSELYLMFEVTPDSEKTFTAGINGKVVRKEDNNCYGIEFEKPLPFPVD